MVPWMTPSEAFDFAVASVEKEKSMFAGKPMLTAKEAFKVAMEARESEEKKKDKINQVAKWISEAASEGKFETKLEPDLLPLDVTKHFTSLGFTVFGDPREYYTISWGNS